MGKPFIFHGSAKMNGMDTKSVNTTSKYRYPLEVVGVDGTLLGGSYIYLHHSFSLMLLDSFKRRAAIKKEQQDEE